MSEPKFGDLQVWWIPQVGMSATFTVPVATVAEGAKLLETLALYDLFQLDNRIKPDYCNVGGLSRYEENNGDDVPGWCDWYDEETGEDDQQRFVEACYE